MFYSGMSIFRFSAEFRFFFLLSAFLKIIFRFFLKSRRQKKKKKESAGLCHRHYRESSKSFESAASPLGAGNMTPAAMQLVIVRTKTVPRLLFLTYSTGCLEDWGRGGGRGSFGGIGEGRVVVKWWDGRAAQSDRNLTIGLQHLHPLPFPLPFFFFLYATNINILMILLLLGGCCRMRPFEEYLKKKKTLPNHFTHTHTQLNTHTHTHTHN